MIKGETENFEYELEEVYLKEIPIIELECTFAERYFEKYDKLYLNFEVFQCISRPYKDENGNWKVKLIPCGVEHPSAIYKESIHPQLQEEHYI